MAITMDTWRLNPALDLAKYAEIYARRGIVQIPDVLAADSAAALNAILSGPVPWRVLATDTSDNPVHFSQAEISAMPKEQRDAMFTDIMLRARKNKGYLYHTYPMVEAYLQGWDPGHPLHTVTEFVNSDPYLGLGRRVLGVPGVNRAEVHATSYSPSHFLTRHIDINPESNRRAAYVLGMTKDWQPDWGGMLLFLNEKQDVTEGYLPRFNILTIFDIKYLHTVTQVSSFAGGVRRAITGWFRDDPLPPNR